MDSHSSTRLAPSRPEVSDAFAHSLACLFAWLLRVSGTEYQDLLVQFKPLSNKRYVEAPTVSSSHRGAALECKKLTINLQPCARLFTLSML